MAASACHCSVVSVFFFRLWTHFPSRSISLVYTTPFWRRGIDAAPLSVDATALRHLRKNTRSRGPFSIYPSTESVCLWLVTFCNSQRLRFTKTVLYSRSNQQFMLYIERKVYLIFCFWRFWTQGGVEKQQNRRLYLFACFFRVFNELHFW